MIRIDLTRMYFHPCWMKNQGIHNSENDEFKI